MSRDVTDRDSADDVAVRDISIQVQDIELSGLFAATRGKPRATIIALHGGGMSARYFHGPASPDISLLTLGASLDYNVFALDRPGYGASLGLPFPRGRIVDQAEMMFEAMDFIAREHDIGAGFFVVAHSFGMKVAIAMAAHARGAELLGVECSGAGLRYDPAQLYLFDDMDAPRPKGLQRRLFWGPELLYPEGTFTSGMRPIADVPEIEKDESVRWPELLQTLAPKVVAPIHLSVADHECWWDFSAPAQQALHELFSHSAHFEISQQPFGGHNLSLGKSARAYHLKALAFAEECILRKQLSPQLTIGNH